MEKILPTHFKYKALSNIVFILVFGMFTDLNAQYAGTINVPSGTNFPTLRAVVDSLNLYGISASVTINITADQTSPPTTTAGGAGYRLGSAVLNASVSSTKTITIQGNAKTITGHVGNRTPGFDNPDFTALSQDVIFILKGLDYVTFNNLIFTDPTSNNTSTTAMESAICMYNLSSTSGSMDGCQNITITNCTFNMQDVGSNGHTIMACNSLANSILNLTWSDISDVHRNIMVTGCTFSEGFDPFYIKGDVAPFSAKSIKFNNNIVSNSGGGSISFVTSKGVSAFWVDTIEVKGNTITTDGDITNLDDIFGMRLSNIGGVVDVYNNSITLNCRTAGTHIAIYSDASQNGQPFNLFNNIKIRKNTLNLGSVSAVSPNDAPTFQLISGNIGATNTSFELFPNQTLTIDSNTISNLTIPGSGNLNFIGASANFFNGNGATAIIKDNNLNNNTRNGVGGFTNCIWGSLGINGSINNNSLIDNKFISIPTATGSTDINGFIGINCQGGSNSTIHHNTISGLNVNSTTTSTSTTSVVGILNDNGSSSGNNIHDNLIYNIGVPSTYANSATTIGIQNSDWNSTNILKTYNNRIDSLVSSNNGFTGGIINESGSKHIIYNNSINNLTAPTSLLEESVIGIADLFNGEVDVINNTIRIGYTSPVTSTGSIFGGSGISVSTGVSKIKNNIVNIKGIPGVTDGSFVAFRERVAGTASLKPSNISASNNLFYVNPLGTNYIYAEGTLNPLTNAYFTSGTNIVGTLDVNFNSACGLYKIFMSDLGTFTEDNLSASGPMSNTYVPSGSSFAKSSASVINFSLTDINNTSRGAFPDMGACQFSATSIDGSGPIINYTNLKNVSCAPTSTILTATIVDPSGINTSAGTKPRLYYRKTSNNNTFGANTSATNGWKYVEASNASTPFTFTIDYTLLNGGTIALGDTMEYFVVAQDLATTPNVTMNEATLLPLGTCPSSVNIAAAAGLTGAVVVNRFLFEPVPLISTAFSPQISCQGDTVKHFIFISNPAAVTPSSYAVSSATSNLDDEIFSVTIGSMTNVSTCTSTGGAAGGPFSLPLSVLNQYSNFTTSTPAVAVPDLISGGTYPWGLLLGTTSINWDNGYSIFIDYNRNGVFDLPQEKIAGSTAVTTTPNGCTAGTGVVFSGNFTVPTTDVNSGITLLRVVQEEGNPTPSPTGTYGWGETEDYAVNIISTPDSSSSTFSWTSNKTGTTILGNKSTLFHATVDTSTIYTCSMNLNGCPYSVQDTVLANKLPNAPIATNSAQCGSKVPTCKVKANNTFITPPIYNWYSSNTSSVILQSSTDTFYNNIVKSAATSTSGTVNVYLYASVIDPTTGCESPRTQVTIATSYADSIWAKINNIKDSVIICEGSSVVLTAGNGSSTPSVTYSTYTWSASDVNSGISSPLSNATGTQSITPLSSGTYILTVSGISSSGCSNLNSIKLIVNQNPFLNVPKFVVANPNPICIGSSAVHTVYLGANTGVNPTNYGASAAGNSFDDEIFEVTIGSLVNTSGCTGANATDWPAGGPFNSPVSDPNMYSNYTNGTTPLAIPDLISGTSYPWSITYGNLTSIFDIGYAIFIDYNRDGTFQTSEKIAGSTALIPAPSGCTPATGATSSGTFTIPNTGVESGLTLMRVVVVENNPTPSATGIYGWGETEDYTVNLVSSPPPSITYQWKSNQTGNTILSTANPTAPLNLTVSPTIYTVKMTQGSCVDSIRDTVTSNVPPFAINPISGATSSCQGDIISLKVSATGGCLPYTYAWSSTGGTFNVTNKDTVSFYPVGASGNKTVSVTVTDNSGATLNTSTIILHSNPIPTNIVSDTICGTGSGTLLATLSNPANILKWFSSPTSLAPIGTGSPFTTPVINTNTSYWVREISTNISNVMPYGNTANLNNLGNLGEVFSTSKNVVINSVDVYPIGVAGPASVEIGIFDKDGIEVDGSPMNINFIIPASNTATNATNTAVNLPLGINIPKGDNYRILTKSSSNVTGFNFEFNIPSIYPLTSTGGNFTLNGACSGFTTLFTDVSLVFFNFEIEEGCIGSAVKDSVKVIAAPAFSISSKRDSICSGSATSAKSITTPLANYNTYTWNPNVSIAGNQTTGYIFNEPIGGNYMYQIKAEQTTGNLCTSYDTFYLKVIDLPTNLSLTPTGPLTICNGTSVMLEATSNAPYSNKIGAGTLTSDGDITSPFDPNWHDHRVQYIYTAAELTAKGFVAGLIDSMAYIVLSNSATTANPNITITMGHTMASTINSYLSYSNPTVVYSNAALAWPPAGTFNMPFSTPFIWDGTSNILVEICQDNTSWGGLMVFESSTFNPSLTFGSFQDNFIGTVCTGTLNNISNPSKRPNAIFYQLKKFPIAWTPFTNLYTDAATSNAYTGTISDTIYAKPSDTIKYYVTAASTPMCSKKDSIIINVQDSVTISTQPDSLVVLCQGSALHLTINATSTSPISYQWKKNGANITGNVSATTNHLIIPNTTLNDSANYQVLVSTLGACTPKLSTISTVKIKRQPTITVQPTPISVCQNNSFTLTSVGAGDSAIKWTQIGGTNTSNTASIIKSSAQYSDSGKYFVTYYATFPCIHKNSDTVMVSVKTKANIVTDPLPTSTICIGQSTTLKATHTGSLGFQWLKNGVSIPGANKDSFVVVANALADSGEYRLIVNSPSVCVNDTTSINTGLVKITPPVQIVTQPQANDAGCLGNPYNSLKVKATNASTYQWMKNGVDMAGQTSDTLKFTTFTISDTGNYSVRINGKGTCPYIVSNTSHVTATSFANFTTDLSKKEDICILTGNTKTLSVAATGAQSYQWYKNGTAISGQTNNTLILNGNSGVAGRYSVVAIAYAGCTNDTSAIDTIIESTPLTINPLVTNKPIYCEFDSMSINSSVSGSGIKSYQWYKNSASLVSSDSIYKNPAVGITDSGNYHVVVTTSTSCPPISSALKRVDVNASPILSTTLNSLNPLCIGDTIKLNATVSNYTSLNWYKDGVLVGSNTSYIKKAALADSGVYKAVAVALAGCKNDTSKLTIINVDVPVSIAVQPIGAYLIENPPGSHTLKVQAAGTPSFTYQWYKDGNPIMFGGNTDEYSISSYIESQHQGYYYCNVTSMGVCNNTASSNAVQIATTNCPKIISEPIANISICEGNVFTLYVNASGASRYQWYKDGDSIPGAVYKYYSVNHATDSNKGNYVVRVFEMNYPSPACTVTMSKISTVQIEKKSVITAQPTRNALCQATSHTLNVSATNATKYQWFKNGDSIVGANSSSYTQSPISALGDTFVVAVSNNVCPIISSNNTILKSVDPKTQVALTLVDQIDMVAQCTDSVWTYYGKLTDPSKFYLAIRKSDSATAYPDIRMRSKLREIGASNVENRGAIFGTRLFNIDFNSPIYNSYDVKFYYSADEENAVLDKYKELKAAGGSRFVSGRGEKVSFITSTQLAFSNDVLDNVSIPFNIKNTIVSDADFGFDNGVKYIVIKSLVAKNGGGTLFMDYFMKSASAINVSTDLAFTINLYPVPSAGEINIALQSEHLKPVQFVITDISGREVARREDKHTSFETKHTFDFSNFANGTYQIQVSNGENNTSAKFTIMK